MPRLSELVVFFAWSLNAGTLLAAPASQPAVIDIAPVWAGHPVGFCLLTNGGRQFVAFYDDQRRMTVAARSLDSRRWDFVRLPETLGWDSHNYVTMAIDDNGCLHLSGNMHCVPLVYFRTSRRGDIHSFERIPMIGRNEKRCTYPSFFRGPDGRLIFTYRDGSSGSGDQLYNVYDCASRTWRRLIDGPLVSGEGETNAYLHGPVRDRAGMYHLCWVWRDTGDCATNHDLCYARSRDLVQWEMSSGKRLKLPITGKTAEVVDPVPAGGGIINGNTKIGFDSQGRVILSYHKYDSQGRTQIYNARLEGGRWRIRQASQWKSRWGFSGGGSIRFDIRVGPVQPTKGGLLQTYDSAEEGSGTWLLDETTLLPIRETRTAAGSSMAAPRSAIRPDKSAASQPSAATKLTRDASALQPRRAGDLGSGNRSGVRYELRWETLGPNRDRPRPGPPPQPSMLRLYVLTDKK